MKNIRVSQSPPEPGPKPDPELGPRPAATTTPKISRAQEAVLAAVREGSGPVTLADLSAATGLHANTLRGHLEALVAAGLVHSTTAPPSGRGRPATLWHAHMTTSAEYAGLAAALAHTVKQTSPEPTVAAIEAGRVWGRQLAGVRRARETTPTDPHAGTIGVLRDLGFAPQPAASTDRDPGTRLRLTRCPLLEAAREEPTIVCNVHLGLIAGALEEFAAPDPDVQLTPFAEPGACTLWLSAGNAR